METVEVPEQSTEVRTILADSNLNLFSSEWDRINGKNSEHHERLCFFLRIMTKIPFSDFPAICSFPKDEGSSECGQGEETRFYYDYVTGYCREMRFRGCGGNGNSFGTWHGCSEVCGFFQGGINLIKS